MRLHDGFYFSIPLNICMSIHEPSTELPQNILLHNATDYATCLLR